MQHAGRDDPMTRVIASLFILGFIWVPFAWVPVVYLFVDGPWNERHIMSLAVFVGYWVWFGWGWHCLTGRFPLVSTRQFWTISLATHLIWLAVILDDARLRGPQLSFFSLWIMANVIVAFFGLLPESRSTGLPKKVVQATCYGLATFTAFMALATAGHADNIPGMTAFVLLMAAIALFVMARNEPHEAD
jgi:hypothetical protein